MLEDYYLENYMAKEIKRCPKCKKILKDYEEVGFVKNKNGDDEPWCRKCYEKQPWQD